MIYKYEFLGIDGYVKHIDEIKRVCKEALKTTDRGYYMAINEAVCNAARYAVVGPEKVFIKVMIRVDPNEIKTKVESVTKKTDILCYREKLRGYAVNEDFKGKDWQDAWNGKTAGRGFWLMLSACDYIFVDRYGQHVELHASIPFIEETMQFKMEKVVSRFFIDDQGMIL